MVPKGWQIKTISELLDRVNKPVAVEPNLKYREIGIRSHCKGIFYKDAVTGKSLGNKRVFHIEPDCFVVNIVFAWEQAVARTTKNELGMIASHRFPMFRPKNNSCDIDYLLYLFKTDYGKYLLSLASPGGAGRNKTLGQTEFARLEILVPPVDEQKKIASILLTWDKAISTVQILLTNCHRQKKSLAQQLLTGKKRFSGFSREWRRKPLIDIATIIMGSSPKSEAYNKDGNGLPLLQGNADIKNRLSVPRIFTSEITKECLSDDILLSVRAPVGAVSISQHHACIGRGIAAIRAKENFSQSYIYQCLLSYEECWGRISQGSTFESVNSDDIKNIKLNIPELEEQEKIAAVLTSTDREIQLLLKKLDFLKQEKKALMQQLLTGQKRVIIN